jgi:MFS superfamily sulfate permease-like transporter
MLKERINYQTTNLRFDIPAGLSVFLVAIPLSLGIALASGAPLFSGLITGIVGGIIVAPLSGSALGISGTAAGLAIIVAHAVAKLGFPAFLLAAFLAGLLQVFMGLLRAGVIAYYFPSSVINGMLSGIGVILVLKQIPHALGYDRDYEGDINFIQMDHYSSFSELPHMWQFISPTACMITALSLLILFVWERPAIKNQRLLGWFQGILITIVAGIGMNQLLLGYFPDWALRDSHLVTIPIVKNSADLLDQLHFPDFSAITNPQVYLTAVTLAVVGSLETLLSIEAVDKLDVYKRVTPANRELVAQGIGNICSALLGGIPLTQVIVRSSMNVQAGAKTKLSGFVHGVLLLIAVLGIPEVLNKIPLASLACVLLLAAVQLAKPEVFKQMFQAGPYHFVPYCLTIVALVFTDMLTGILVGLSAALFAILLENYKGAFYFQRSKVGNKIIFKLSEQVSFLNKANIKQTLELIPAHSEVVLDATRSKYIDYDIYEIIQDFKSEAALKKIKLTIENLRGFGSLPPISNARPPTYDAQQALTAAQVLALLKEGNERFVNNLEANRNLLEQINDTRQGQFPIAIILSCMDSRTSVELIFDQGLGDIFSVRIAGNIINDDILGSMEYACQVAGSKLIVVLGHSQCGAIKGACSEVRLDHLTGLLEKIKPVVAALRDREAIDPVADQDRWVQQVADHNVRQSVAQIRKQSPLLATLENTGEIAIVGAMYDIASGKVHFFAEA